VATPEKWLPWGQRLMESRLQRIEELSRSLLGDLASDKKLSAILPQARFLAEVKGDLVEVAWLDNEIYGMGRVPFAKQPRETAEERQGTAFFMELHGAMDPEKRFSAKRQTGQPSADEMVMQVSVGEIETLSMSEHPDLKRRVFTIEGERDVIKLAAAAECERVVAGVRAALHKYVSGVWLAAVHERENISLLGPDYRIVVDSLNALETGVGDELRAALDNLRGQNPASWRLAAMSCRNVIIKLGDGLWQVAANAYDSHLDGKQLDLKGDKEKNKVYAYLDYRWRRCDDEADKETLGRLHDLVWRIYDVGSKAKRAIRHEEAKTIVVDTFDFVAQLLRVTTLEPVYHL